jgi:hypothetical protein
MQQPPEGLKLGGQTMIAYRQSVSRRAERTKKVAPISNSLD